jgi:hypothetical protein
MITIFLFPILDEIIGIKEPDESIHDHGKVVVEAVDRGSKRRKQFFKNLNRPDHRIKPEDNVKT